jgi:integrase
MSRSSRFGYVEKLPSAKWRARCTGPDGVRRSATFRTKTDARVWLSTIEASIARKTWRPPEAGRVTVGEYADGYISRTDLRPSTRALYESTWRNHLHDEWERVAVADVTRERVRLWHGSASRATKPTALAISYRLLRSILNVAVGDGAIPANPCQIRSAAAPKPAVQARTLTAAEVQMVAEAMPSRYRALVLVLGFGGLRFGEATALRRSDVADDGSTVTIDRSVRYLNGDWVVGPPKSEAGRRQVALPGFVSMAVEAHLQSYVADDPEATVFATASGLFVARQNFSATFGRALAKCGLPPARVHWLRHTGATLAAGTGASTKELMHRLGHASPAAALGYQHAVSTRDSEIARALNDLVSPQVAHANLKAKQK